MSRLNYAFQIHKQVNKNNCFYPLDPNTKIYLQFSYLLVVVFSKYTTLFAHALTNLSLWGNQPCFLHVVNKHWKWSARNFKRQKAGIELLLRRTIYQTSSGFHDIISCIFLSNQGFALCLQCETDTVSW